MSGRYYTRVRGRKNGPFTVEQLHSLARRGRFARHYEVSTDGRTWRQAADFPELFARASDEDDAVGDDDWDGESDLGEAHNNPPPRPEKRSRPASRSNKDDDDLVPPPPIDFDDLFSSDPDRNSRRRPVRGRPSADAPRQSIPLTNDPEDDFDADETVPPENGSVRRRSSERTTAAPLDDIDIPLWEPVAETPRGSRQRQRQQQKPAKSPPAPKAVPDKYEEESEVDEPVVEKKTGGFFGFFRGKSAAEDELPEHLRELNERSARLPKQTFGLDKIMLIGSRGQELPVVGHADSGDGIQTLGLLVMIAYQTRSTDIHFEPKEDSYEARMRVDGMLVPIVQIPRDVGNRVAGVIKVLCAIDFAGQLGIQEGSFSATAPGRRSDFRISFTPSVHGQKLAIRILDVANSPQSLDSLGAPKSLITRLQHVMGQNAGMILVCGPTGSGKSTTLYSLIRSIDCKSRNVMTIEDPVEYRIEGVTQSSVDAGRGKNFSDMLRALLRQDPDVLLLGEIRDAESARISMQATMTGHLVLSTVHAQDTINTVFRLLDLGADPNLVASSLNMVLAQRLVRVLCTHCRKRRPPDSEERRRMGQLARDFIYEATGCVRCLGTGYFGRRALFELLETNDRLKDVMLKKPTLLALKAAVKGPGFVTLRADGYRLIAQGVTTSSEVDRVIGLER